MPPSPVTQLRTGTRANGPQGAQSGSSKAGSLRSGESRTVAPYDFRRPTKLSREHARVLQMAYETFAGRLTTLLTSGLRQVCQVTAREVTQQSYDEYVGELGSPTLVVPVDVAPLGMGALELSLPVALAAIDHMLGGPGGTQPVRTLTDIETSIFARLVEQIFGVLRYALDPICPVRLEAGPIEYNPQFLQVANAGDAVVVAHFDLVIGRESSSLTLCLPLAPLLPRLTIHKPREATPSGPGTGAQPHLRERLAGTTVELQVRFAPVALDSAIVLGLDVGDVVPLGQRVGTPLQVLVGGSPVASAIAGKAGAHLAALIVEPPAPAIKELL